MALTPEQIRRRVKAARALAGLSIPALAEAVNEPGLGDRTIRAMEGEKGRPFRKMELEAIARVCGLPYAFFTVDFARLPELEGELVDVHGVADRVGAPLREIQTRLAAIEDELGLRDVARSTNRSLTEALDRAGEAGHPAARGTRDASDANEESDAAPARERPSSAGPPGG